MEEPHNGHTHGLCYFMPLYRAHAVSIPCTWTVGISGKWSDNRQAYRYGDVHVQAAELKHTHTKKHLYDHRVAL